MKVAIYSTDESHKHGFYSKIDGLLKAAKQLRGELEYRYVRWNEEEQSKYDVVINWEPFGKVFRGKQLTIAWVWDTHRISMKNQCVGFNVLFRAHATFYHPEDVDPRRTPIYWMPPAVDEEVFKRDPEIRPEYDIVWVGQQRYMPEFKILRNNFKMLVIHGGLPYKEYIETFCKGRLILNVPVKHETNKRVMEAMAVGPALMPWGPDYTLLATPGRHFAWYHSIWKSKETEKEFEKRLVKRVKYYLGRPKLLSDIQFMGRWLVSEQFTFKHQIRRVETIIKKHIK